MTRFVLESPHGQRFRLGDDPERLVREVAGYLF
jgi:hypothetical protein